VLTANGDRLKSMFGLGRSAWMLGGSTLWWSAMAALNRPAVPAAPFRWPMFDFTEPSGIDPTGTPSLPNTSVSASTSTTSPTAVDVPCPSTSEHVDGATPARSQARSTASFCPIGLGAVMPLPFPSLDPATPSSTA
jgi:hypothetical protein